MRTAPFAIKAEVKNKRGVHDRHLAETMNGQMTVQDEVISDNKHLQIPINNKVNHQQPTRNPSYPQPTFNPLSPTRYKQ